MSDNESENVFGGCPGELDEASLEVALSAIIEEHQGQSSATDDLSHGADSDPDAVHCDAEIAKSLETIASCAWPCRGVTLRSSIVVGQCGRPQVHAVD